MRAPMASSHPARIWAAALGVAVIATGCGSSSPRTTPTTTSTAVVTPTSGPQVTPPLTAGVSPTTTPATPSGAGSAESAAQDLISAWADSDRGAAAAVATVPAISTLFASHYPGGDLVGDRGCGDTPVVCSFGPPGGADPDDALYQLTVEQTSSGRWYVAVVLVEG